MILWKVLTAAQSAVLLEQGSFAGSPADLADGFIHLSTAAQLDGTLAKHFAGQDDLRLVAFDAARLGNAVRWEESRGGQMFPHCYAALGLAAVLAHGPLQRDGSGAPILPAAG